MVVFYTFVWNLLIILTGGPLLSWMFREVLHSDGMVAVDLATTSITDVRAVSVVLLMLMGLVALAFYFMESTTILFILKQKWNGRRARFRAVAQRLGFVLKKLLNPSSMILLPYVFVVIPLSGLGFVSVLTQGIAVPNFITGELVKDPTTAALWHLLMAVMLYANIKLSLTVPLFILSDATGTQAIRRSWKAVKGKNFWVLVGSGLAILLGAGVVTTVLPYLFVAPTWITDQINVAASPYVAALSIAVAQVVVAVWYSIIIVLLTSVLLVVAEHSYQTLSKLYLSPVQTQEASRLNIRWGWVITGLSAVITVPLSIAYYSSLESLVTYPESEVFGHRGWVSGGVENTLGALEAAAELGADRVEMDVMQTKDGKFVVIHDPGLSRLAGMDKKVKDMTQEELMAVTVHDRSGHADTIPSLEEYINKSKELGMPLLIEVKMGGLDTPDHVDLLVEELERLDGLEGNMFHSLDPASVEKLKELLPDTKVGYIMPFAGQGIPNTSADFLVLEEYTASQKMHAAAQEAGLGFVVWTVDEADAQRLRFRQGVDAIITDHPNTAMNSKTKMQEQAGVAPALLDLLENLSPI